MSNEKIDYQDLLNRKDNEIRLLEKRLQSQECEMKDYVIGRDSAIHKLEVDIGKLKDSNQNMVSANQLMANEVNRLKKLIGNYRATLHNEIKEGVLQ